MRHHKRILVALCALFASIACAQSPGPTGVLVRVGQFYPSDIQARHEAKTWILFGLQVNVGKMRPTAEGGMAGTAISIDAYQKGDLSAIPIMLNYVSKNDATTFTVGAGGSFNREARSTSSGLEKTNRLQFAYGASLGYDLDKVIRIPGMIELRYLGNSYSTLNGFAICYGFRF